MVVILGSGMSLLDREEEKQCDYSATAVSGVLPEFSVINLSSGYGGLYRCSHTEGSYYYYAVQDTNVVDTKSVAFF